MSYVVREIVTDVSRDLSTSQVGASGSVSGNLKVPNLTCEQFILINVELDRLATLCRTLAAENESLKFGTSQQNELYAEIDRLRRENEGLKKSSARVSDLKLRINALMQENQRLSVQYGEKSQEVDALRARVTELEPLITRVRDLEAERQRPSEIISRLQQEVDQLRTRVAVIPQLEQRLEASERENQALRQALQDRERLINESRVIALEQEVKIIQEPKGRIALPSFENERLNSIITERVREIESLRIRVVELERTVAIIPELQGKISLLASENERLNVLLIEKIREVDKLTHTKWLKLKMKPHPFTTLSAKFISK